MKRSFLFVLGIASLFFLTSVPVGAQTKAPIKIGLLNSFSGNFAFSGVRATPGAQVWADYINEKGGVPGLNRTFELIVADVKSDPKVAAAETERLITEKKVDFIITDPHTPTAAAEIAKAFQYGTPTLTGGASTVEQIYHPFKDKKTGNGWVLGGNAASTDTTGQDFGNVHLPVIEKYGIAHATNLVVSSSNPFSKGAADGVMQLLKSKGWNAKQVIYEQSKPILTDEVTVIKAADPDILWLCDIYGIGVKFWKALYASGWFPKYVAVCGTVGSDPKLAIDGLSPEMFQATVARKNVMAAYYLDQNIKSPGNLEFLKRLRAKVDPNTIDSSSYWSMGAVCALYFALQKSKATDYDSVHKAIHDLKVDKLDPMWATPLYNPHYWVDKDGIPRGQRYAGGQWRDGKLVFVWPTGGIYAKDQPIVK